MNGFEEKNFTGDEVFHVVIGRVLEVAVLLNSEGARLTECVVFGGGRRRRSGRRGG